MAEQPSELSKLLLHVIEKYEQGDESYDVLCVTAEQQDDAVFDDTFQTVTGVREATDKELKSRIFDSAKKTDTAFSDLLGTNPQITRSISLDELRRTREEWAEIASASESKPEIAVNSVDEHLPPTQLPDLYAFFAKEFVVNLDRIVSRVEGLDEFKCNEVPSPHLKSLLQEAHRCYLHGFERATAVLCGAILEEALEDAMPDWRSEFLRLPKDKKMGELEFLINQACERKLIGKSKKYMGHEVRKLRNDAVHDLPKFDGRSADMRATVLSNTRTVVGILLSGNSDSKES